MAYADSLRLTGIFMDIHENPELGFMKFVLRELLQKN